jgi:hypothetical protein
MNAQFKTVLLTILTLSCFVIALVELSGVSKTALINKFGSSTSSTPKEDPNSIDAKMKEMREIPKTIIKFDTTHYSFGTINEGDVVKHAFHFKNIGNSPLLIANAAASCGCTVPSYPKQPVPPGGESDIVVEFNSHGKKGHQQKNVMIYSNAQQEAMSIGFDAEVKEK